MNTELEYSSNVTLTSSLISQRIRYFMRGNYHGVSANWLAKQVEGIFQSVDGLVLNCGEFSNLDKSLIAEGERVYLEVLQENSGMNLGKNYDCEIGLASFLYSFIISTSPEVVIETGIANGITTNVIMRALEQTGGSLHSFDIDSRTSNVYSGFGKWEFHLLKENYERDLAEQVLQIHQPSLWVHDSNHGFKWQAFEYSLAHKTLDLGGVLVSDDIDSSTAWGIIGNQLFDSSFAVFDKRKFFGIATFRN